jgi:hypothetical protein
MDDPLLASVMEAVRRGGPATELLDKLRARNGGALSNAHESTLCDIATVYSHRETLEYVWRSSSCAGYRREWAAVFALSYDRPEILDWLLAAVPNVRDWDYCGADRRLSQPAIYAWFAAHTSVQDLALHEILHGRNFDFGRLHWKPRAVKHLLSMGPHPELETAEQCRHREAAGCGLAPRESGMLV